MAKYSAQDKARFFDILGKYRESLKNPKSDEFIAYSIAIHGALVNVPKSYKRYVTMAFNSGGE